MELIKRIAHFGPLMFAVGFLAPLAAQVMVAAGITPPFGLTPLVAGLLFGLIVGIPAQIRRRWL